MHRIVSEVRDEGICGPHKRVGIAGKEIRFGTVIPYHRLWETAGGKTALISEFLKGYPDSLCFLATEEPGKPSLRRSKAPVEDFTGNGLLRSAGADRLTVFGAHVSFRTETRKVIVFDEFQCIGQSDPAFLSVMQRVWDTLLENADVMLILCGSQVSVMKSQTLDYSSPLYGRRTGQIRLGQIPFSHYHEFFDGQSGNELLPACAVTNCAPKCTEAFRGCADVCEAVGRNVPNPESCLCEETHFLLRKEVSGIGSCFSLIKPVATENRRHFGIAADPGLKQTGLTKYLKVLTDLDLVEREVPVTETAPEKSKSGLYRITDNFIAFWFRFVYPYRAWLEKGETACVMAQIRKGFVQNCAAFVYEDVCREKMWELSAAGTWDFRFDRVGRYWGTKAGETDIVAIDTAGGNLILGECKYASSPKGLSALHALRKKSEALLRLTGTERAHYVLFSTAGFTQGLEDEAERSAAVTLVGRL